MSNKNWNTLSNSRLLPVSIAAFGIVTVAFSQLYIGDQFGISFHFQSAWLSTLLWVILAGVTCGLWSLHLYLQAVSTSEKKRFFWQQFGASLAMLGIFLILVSIKGSSCYYFDTLMSGSDRMHQTVKSIEVCDGTRLVLYWCIQPALSPCILFLSVQKQLPFGMVIEKNLHTKEGFTDCALSLNGNTAILRYNSKSLSFPLD